MDIAKGPHAPSVNRGQQVHQSQDGLNVVIYPYERLKVVSSDPVTGIDVTRREALKAIEKLQKNADTLIVIPNDRLLDIADEQTALQDAFLLADDVLRQRVLRISDIITVRMVSCDNLQTARAIALECGILGSDADATEPNLIEGKVFHALSEVQRREIADKISVMGGLPLTTSCCLCKH